MAESLANDKNVDELTGTLAEVLYRGQLEALTNTLERFRVSQRAYTVLGDRDESVCLVSSEGKWKVYMSERGRETDCKVTDDIEEACKNLIYRMSENDEEYKQMLNHYSYEMDSHLEAHPSWSDFYGAIKEGLKKISKSVAAL